MTRPATVQRGVPVADIVIALGFLVVAVAALLQARHWPFRAALFPLGTGFILLAAASLKLLLDIVHTRRQVVVAAPATAATEDEEEEAEPDVFVTATRAEWMSALGWSGAFFLMLWLLGALIGIPLFALVYLLVASRTSPVVATLYALACWAFVYGLFVRVLSLPLPPGALWGE